MKAGQVGRFWGAYEGVATSFNEVHEAIHLLASTASNRTIVWRGQANSEWGLTSKLHRNFDASNPKIYSEEEMAKFEQSILKQLRQWGLHSQRLGGRLSILSQLAMLQHFDSPTRFLDVSFNALIGLFFAVAFDPKQEENDARLFAIDVTEGMINERKRIRDWEDSIDTPWSESFIRQVYESLKTQGHAAVMSPPPGAAQGSASLTFKDYLALWRHEWSSNPFAWKPPALDPRLAAQSGGFLFGGLISSTQVNGYLDIGKSRNKSVVQISDPSRPGKFLVLPDARAVTSVAIRPQRFPKTNNTTWGRNKIYTIRLSSSAKEEIRRILKRIYGIGYPTIYPDFQGFSKYGELD